MAKKKTGQAGFWGSFRGPLPFSSRRGKATLLTRQVKSAFTSYPGLHLGEDLSRRRQCADAKRWLTAEENVRSAPFSSSPPSIVFEWVMRYVSRMFGFEYLWETAICYSFYHRSEGQLSHTKGVCERIFAGRKFGAWNFYFCVPYFTCETPTFFRRNNLFYPKKLNIVANFITLYYTEFRKLLN